MLKALNALSGKLDPRRRKSALYAHEEDTTEDLQKRLDELSILNKMSVALSSGQDLYHLLRLLLEELKKLFVIDSFYIGVYHSETSLVSFPIYYEKGEYLDVESRNLRERPGFTGAVIFDEKTLYIPDLDNPVVDQQYGRRQPVGKAKSRSYLGVPLMLQNGVIGILSVQSGQPHAYTAQQIQLLETLAAQSAMAIGRARLFSELQDELEQRKKLITELEIKNVETETLRESVSIITATLEKADAIDLILDQLERVVPYDSASVQLINENKLEIVKGRGLHHEVMDRAWQFNIDDSEPAYPILREHAPYVLYEDIQLVNVAFKVSPHDHIHAWLAVPLKIKDKMLGIITLDGNSVGQFTEHHARLAVTYANQVAIALENANLFAEIQAELDRRKELIVELETKSAEAETLHASLASIVGTFEFSEIIQRILDQIQRVVPYDSASVWRLEGDRQKLLGGCNLPPEVSIPGFEMIIHDRNSGLPVFRGEVPYALYNNVQEEHEDFREPPHNYINSWLAVPLKTKGKIIGLICLDGRQKNQFTRHHAELAETFANQVAIALENAQLFSKLQSELAERERSEQEISKLNTELEQRVQQRTAQLQEVNQSLNQEKAHLEQYNRQRELMADMTDLLQASLTMEEASHVISNHLKLLFPKRDGALYLITPSNTFEPVAIWGEKKSLDVIYTTDECWGLRRGKPYRFGAGSPNPPCAHMGMDAPYHALCIPLSAQGESIGNLHISTQDSQEAESINSEEQKFIETIADSISLAIANLRLREKLHHQAIRDSLTGLFNRRFMEETLEREIHRAKRANHPLSVIMLEIDNFRIYNNTYGHEAGDYVIKKLGDTIRASLRRNDFPCRYGGDEFTVILPETVLEHAAQKAEELRKTVQALALSYNNQALGTITLSMGVASFPQHGLTGEDVLKKADAASYKAKDAGKNCVVVSE